MGLFASRDDFKSIADVRRWYSWSVEIVEVDGGWIVFSDPLDAAAYRSQL